MISVTWESVRLSVHVLAATVWLGGQIVLAALVSALRAHGRDVVRAAARRFNLLAWPAYGVRSAPAARWALNNLGCRGVCDDEIRRRGP